VGNICSASAVLGLIFYDVVKMKFTFEVILTVHRATKQSSKAAARKPDT